jgi:hypothetical protein
MNGKLATDIRRPEAAAKRNSSPGSVSEEFLNPVEQPAQQTAQQTASRPERLPLLSRFPFFLSEILDSFSSCFFYLSFSSLTHLLVSWWSRFLAEE